MNSAFSRSGFCHRRKAIIAFWSNEETVERQLQRISETMLILVKSYFDGKEPDELIFSADEMNQKLNLHALRAENAKMRMQHICSAENWTRLWTQWTWSWARWSQLHESKPTAASLKARGNHGYFTCAVANRTFAQIHGFPTHYDIWRYQFSSFRISAMMSQLRAIYWLWLTNIFSVKESSSVILLQNLEREIHHGLRKRTERKCSNRAPALARREKRESVRLSGQLLSNGRYFSKYWSKR